MIGAVCSGRLKRDDVSRRATLFVSVRCMPLPKYTLNLSLFVMFRV